MCITAFLFSITCKDSPFNNFFKCLRYIVSLNSTEEISSPLISIIAQQVWLMGCLLHLWHMVWHKRAGGCWKKLQ